MEDQTYIVSSSNEPLPAEDLPQEAEPVVLHEPPERSPLQKVEDAVEHWFKEHVHNSPVSREAQAWNHIVSTKDALKRILLEHLF